jgi:hypothetical protein
MENSRIPLLKQDANAQDIINYLYWLELSRYAYHIDECPSEWIYEDDVTDEQINILKWNAEVMWRNQSAEFLWSNYGEYLIAKINNQ